MTELKPILRKRFKCDYCGHIPFAKEWTCKRHENKCFRNPNRNCPTCENCGMVDEVMNNGYMGSKNHPCYDCETAERLGGKSFVPEKYRTT